MWLVRLRRPAAALMLSPCSPSKLRIRSTVAAGLFALTHAFVAGAQPQLAIGANSGSPRSAVPVSVTLSGAGNSISAIQFDLSCDSDAIHLSFTAGAAVRTAGKSLYTAVMGPGSERVLIVGLDQASLPDGVLLNLLAGIPDGTAAGTYTLLLSNVAAVGPDGTSVALVASAGAITADPSVPAAPLRPEGVLNAASWQSGPVASGEILVLIAPGVGSLGPPSTLSVWFDQNPAQILAVAADQLMVLVPSLAAPAGQVPVTVQYQGQIWAETTVATASAAPGLFTASGTGVGQGAILNQDSTINSPSNPAAVSTIISLFGTGMSAGGNLPPPSVTVGGLNADVLYFGPAPGLPGVFQINCRIPSGAGHGLSTPVAVQISSASSQDGVRVALR